MAWTEHEEKKRPVRAKIYEIIDEVNEIDRTIWKRHHSSEVRMKFKRIKSLLNAL